MLSKYPLKRIGLFSRILAQPKEEEAFFSKETIDKAWAPTYTENEQHLRTIYGVENNDEGEIL